MPHDRDQDRPTLTLPLTPGVTETIEETGSTQTRLAEFLSRRKGGSTTKLAEGIQLLESAMRDEEDERVISRIGAAVGLLREGPPRGNDSRERTSR